MTINEGVFQRITGISFPAGDTWTVFQVAAASARFWDIEALEFWDNLPGGEQIALITHNHVIAPNPENLIRWPEQDRSIDFTGVPIGPTDASPTPWYRRHGSVAMRWFDAGPTDQEDSPGPGNSYVAFVHYPPGESPGWIAGDVLKSQPA